MEIDTDRLVNAAREAKTNAYAEYSDYKVGAALLTTSEGLFTGCNVENINYTNTIHAEQTALVCAINDGVKRDEFVALVISTDGENPVPPMRTLPSITLRTLSTRHASIC